MPIQLDIVTIEREVFSADDVDAVIAPGSEGVLGVLPRHEPIVTGLQPGVLEIVRGDEREILAIGGGFMEVRADRVIIMADVAEHSGEIDVDRAEEARKRAAASLEAAPAEEDRLEALAVLRRAEVRLKVSRRRRRRSGDSARMGQD